MYCFYDIDRTAASPLLVFDEAAEDRLRNIASTLLWAWYGNGALLSLRLDLEIPDQSGAANISFRLKNPRVRAEDGVDRLLDFGNALVKVIAPHRYADVSFDHPDDHEAYRLAYDILTPTNPSAHQVVEMLDVALALLRPDCPDIADRLEHTGRVTT